MMESAATNEAPELSEYGLKMQQEMQKAAAQAQAEAQHRIYASGEGIMREKALMYALQAASFAVDPMDVVQTAGDYLAFLTGSEVE